MRIARSFAISLGILSIACHSSPLESRTRVIGVIDGGQSSPQVIDAPATASLGQSFSVTVSTFGNSCVTADGADVAIDGLVATITPYDVVVAGVNCLDYSKAYPRVLHLIFGQAGAATIRVKGRSDSQPGLVTVERSLVVN